MQQQLNTNTIDNYIKQVNIHHKQIHKEHREFINKLEEHSKEQHVEIKEIIYNYKHIQPMNYIINTNNNKILHTKHELNRYLINIYNDKYKNPLPTSPIPDQWRRVMPQHPPLS